VRRGEAGWKTSGHSQYIRTTYKKGLRKKGEKKKVTATSREKPERENECITGLTMNHNSMAEERCRKRLQTGRESQTEGTDLGGGAKLSRNGLRKGREILKSTLERERNNQTVSAGERGRERATGWTWGEQMWVPFKKK